MRPVLDPIHSRSGHPQCGDYEPAAIRKSECVKFWQLVWRDPSEREERQEKQKGISHDLRADTALREFCNLI